LPATGISYGDDENVREEAKMTVSAEARVAVTTGEGLRTEVSAGGHTVVADEPESLAIALDASGPRKRALTRFRGNTNRPPYSAFAYN